MIQLPEYKCLKFCITINGFDCVFMPMELYIGNNFKPVKKVLKGSTLGWYVNRKFISYNQIKREIIK